MPASLFSLSFSWETPFLPVLGQVGALWLMAVVVPGLDFLVVSRTSCLRGRRAGLAVSAGVANATLLWGLCGWLGIHALFTFAPFLFVFLKVGGGLYLCYMGIQLVRASFARGPSDRPARQEAEHLQPRAHWSAFFRSGLLTNLANPKAPLFTSALFASAMPAHAPPLLGLTAVGLMGVIALGWFSLVACLLSQPAFSAAYVRFRRWIDRASGAAFLLLGAHFIWEGRN